MPTGQTGPPPQRPPNTWTPILSALAVFVVLSIIVIIVSAKFHGRSGDDADPAATGSPTTFASASAGPSSTAGAPVADAPPTATASPSASEEESPSASPSGS